MMVCNSHLFGATTIWKNNKKKKKKNPFDSVAVVSEAAQDLSFAELYYVKWRPLQHGMTPARKSQHKYIISCRADGCWIHLNFSFWVSQRAQPNVINTIMISSHNFVYQRRSGAMAVLLMHLLIASVATKQAENR